MRAITWRAAKHDAIIACKALFSMRFKLSSTIPGSSAFGVNDGVSGEDFVNEDDE